MLNHRLTSRALPALLAVLLAAPPVNAQAEDQAAARSLFNEGKSLLKAGELADACRKFEAAARTYTSAGILLNLGDCYEKQGRAASAWTSFNEAQSVAGRTGRSEEKAEAGKRAVAVEKKLTRLAIRVPEKVPGLTVSRDGTEIAAAAWGEGVPVDSGKHEVRAEAVGYAPWASSVTVEAGVPLSTIDVPALSPVATRTEPVPVAPAPDQTSNVDTSPDAPPPQQRSQFLPWTLVIAGGVVAAGGLTLMVVEANRSQTASDAGDQAAYESTKTPWAIGLVGTAVGGVALATGVVLLLTGGKSASTTARGVRAEPWIGSAVSGLRLGGTW